MTGNSELRTLPAWKRPFEAPLILAGGIVLLAALLSLVALVYLSWSSSLRLDPLEEHLQHLQQLQAVNVEVQTALINEVHKENRPGRKVIEKISLDLRDMLRARGYLHQDTPGRILAAQDFLLRDGYSIEDNLAATSRVLRQTLQDENEIQRTQVARTRAAARREFQIATFALFAMPVLLLAVLLLTRRRLLAWSSSLTEMLENVRRSNLAPVHLPDSGNPMLPVIERYNAMVERLREIEEEHTDKEQDLERQVELASENLLRVQRHLARAEQLSAIGEFSARVAHELRNPLSGIAVALRNLREEVSQPDRAEVIDLVLEEIQRISRLLDSLLARTPQAREAPMAVSPAKLCRDMVTLFGYDEGTQHVAVEIDVPDCDCILPQDSLRQALLNILRNSAQAMGPEGGKIAISGKVESDRLVLVLEDSGPGYPEDILRHGIRPFRSGKQGGAGLGLSILQRLVQNAGGRLSLEQAPAGGARTVIDLPCDDAGEEGEGTA